MAAADTSPASAALGRHMLATDWRRPRRRPAPLKHLRRGCKQTPELPPRFSPKFGVIAATGAAFHGLSEQIGPAGLGEPRILLVSALFGSCDETTGDSARKSGPDTESLRLSNVPSHKHLQKESSAGQEVQRPPSGATARGLRQAAWEGGRKGKIPVKGMQTQLQRASEPEPSCKRTLVHIQLSSSWTEESRDFGVPPPDVGGRWPSGVSSPDLKG